MVAVTSLQPVKGSLGPKLTSVISALQVVTAWAGRGASSTAPSRVGIPTRIIMATPCTPAGQWREPCPALLADQTRRYSRSHPLAARPVDSALAAPPHRPARHGLPPPTDYRRAVYGCRGGAVGRLSQSGSTARRAPGADRSRRAPQHVRRAPPPP